MSNKAVAEFVDAVLQHFPPFRWEDHQEQTWIDTMVRELGGFSDAVLVRAIGEMIRTRKDRRTPLVSECINACLDARRWVEAEKRSSTLPVAGGDIPMSAESKWAEREANADRLVNCPLGQQAGREGWLGQLHAYAVANGSLPHQSDQNAYAKLKQAAKEFDAIYRDVVLGEAADKQGVVRPIPMIMKPVLERLGAAMLAKRKKLEEMVGVRR